MTNITSAILVFIWVTFMFLLFNSGKIMKVLNLTDRRPLISSGSSYAKLNALFERAEVELYTSETYDEAPTVCLTVQFKNKNGTTKLSFNGKDIDGIIDEAYNWSIEEGFIE